MTIFTADLLNAPHTQRELDMIPQRAAPRKAADAAPPAPADMICRSALMGVNFGC